jgi:hypothetical protein
VVHRPIVLAIPSGDPADARPAGLRRATRSATQHYDLGVTVLIDPPNAPGHGRLWSHLTSDSSFEELHEFAAALGIPPRGFDRDHYDVPAERYDDVVAAGASPVSSRELVARLVTSGLRRRKSERP